jgi:carbon storage regulator CsrA
MLVIRRKARERVVIPIPRLACEIVVQVVKVKGNTVVLGFEAPPGIPIEREERIEPLTQAQ